MDWPSIIGRTGSGFAVRLAAATVAIWLGVEAWSAVAEMLEPIRAALG